MVGVDPVGAIAGTSPRTPASPARSPTRVLRTSRPCRPCHGMCCAAGEGVCTYAPSEERGPRGIGLGEAPHAARYEAMLRVIHPRAPKSHRAGGDPVARAGLAGFSYGPTPTCQQRLAPSPASAVPRCPAMRPGGRSTCTAGASGSAGIIPPVCMMAKRASGWTMRARCRRFSSVTCCGRICSRAGARSSWLRSGTPLMPCCTWTGSYAWQGCASRSRCSGMPITPLVSIVSTGDAWQRPRRLRP